MAIAKAKNSKVLTKKEGSFAKGGTTKMFGRQFAGPDKAGIVTGKTGSGGSFAKGGSGHMFGKQSANPRVSGKTGK